MILNVAYVALGGAVGAALRYLVGLSVVRTLGPGAVSGFPVAIITVNIIGSFLMGVFVVAAANRGLTHLSPLVMTGLLGGFTTFSAFSLETVTLIERGQWGAAGVYVALSVVGSVGALFLGVLVARGVFA
ncbi:putative fluoride ion transporter CrcB [Shimia sp. SK013]|uniref:fluoride efflux transporter CrcB n=1 Tax=Shimia sp. SK013 TaxID=1389006 RepID=UPI0006B544A2|nr:fluoride efflux transporter CrcB [Shimia sp. SK013]KPA20787.1 putative fluoride ion transporter CrcB [Shimia sp. SK013]